MKGCRKFGRRALAILTAMVLTLEGMPLQTLAAVGRDSYIPLVRSQDEDEDEDFTEDAELLDDRPLGARMQLFSTGGLRASG